MGLVGNFFRDLEHQWVLLVGSIFTPQEADPISGSGKPRLWYKKGDDRFHATDATGADDVVATKGYVDTQIGGEVPKIRQIATTAPLTGGGNLSADRTLAISPATGMAAGSMSAADKTKLDGVAAGATNTPLDATAGDIAPLGPAKVAGAVGKAADAGHTHQADVAAFRVKYFAGVDASGGASHVVIAALKVGDQLLEVFNITDGTDGSADFEAVVTVAGQLQQPALDLHLKNFKAIFIAKS